MSAARTRPACFAFAALAALALTGTPLAAQQPTHAYRVDGSLADELGGPSLTPQGGTVGPTSYTFAPNQGLTLANALSPDVYSLELAFTFDRVDGYRRLVDFKARTKDEGLYVYNGGLRFVGGNNDVSTSVVAPRTPVHVLLTRAADQRFTAYVNGVLSFSFLDNVKFATFSGPGSVAGLFLDDLTVPNEASAGALHWARTYDVALTAEQAAARFAAGDDALLPPTTTTPEPGSLALLGAGALGLAGAARRRRAASPAADGN